MDHLVDLLVRYGYGVVFGVTLLENLGLPLPGLVLLVIGGALAAGGKLSPAGVIGLAVLGALIGDLVWYALGRWRGRPVLGWLCRLSLNPDTCVGGTERFFLRHGLPTLLVAKFIPGVNTIAPPLMGTLRARFGRFLAFDAAGAVIFSVACVGAGYLLGFEVTRRAEAAVAQMTAWVGWGLAGFVTLYAGWRLAVRMRVRRALRTVGMSPEELRRLQTQDDDFAVIDVRSPLAVRDKPCRIPGALHAAQDDLHRVADGWAPERRIITYCV